MTPEENVDRPREHAATETRELRALVSEQAKQIGALADVVNALASSAASRRSRIEAEIIRADELNAAIASLEKRWRAYINTLPRN